MANSVSQPPYFAYHGTHYLRLLYGPPEMPLGLSKEANGSCLRSKASDPKRILSHPPTLI